MRKRRVRKGERGRRMEERRRGTRGRRKRGSWWGIRERRKREGRRERVWMGRFWRVGGWERVSVGRVER